jgi:4-hydroxy-4-methyl-2-oxoglutarate aldolase
VNLGDRLEGCYTGAVYDVLRAMGQPQRVLPPTIRPLDPSYKLAGRVYTVSGHVDHSLDAHETLLQWTALLSRAPADSVVICQPNDSTLAHMGELSAETLQYRGVRGYIVDGGCRDSDFILGIGFKVFCRYFTPIDLVGRWIADGFGEPIVVGDVTLETEDYVLADRDGVVIIAAEIVDEVVTRTEEVMKTEDMVRKAILGGVDPQKAYLEYGKF